MTTFGNMAMHLEPACETDQLFINKSATELVDDLRSGRISAQALLEITIAQADYAAEAFNPFAIKLYDRARLAAIKADELLAQGLGGPLCGLPITVKDSQWLAGVPCCNGSRSQLDFIPDETCAAIQRLEDAGAVIFAKTTCPEFSLMGVTHSELYGVTSNPWDTSRVCGGSSGGAGAAIAAGAGTLSLGGDGGGSIRIPAAMCGIVGFKPSFGSVPREPCFESWKSLVSYGPMTRTVADARLMYTVMAESPALDSSKDQTNAGTPMNLQGQKIIISEDLGFAPVNDDVRLRFRQVVALLADAGAELIYDQPKLPSSVVAWATVAHYDSWDKQKQKMAPLTNLDETTLEMMEFGASLSYEEFLSAEEYRITIAEAYAALFERTGSSFLLTPTLGFEAFEHGSRHPEYIGSTKIEYPWLDWAGFLYDANLTGMPACALPMGLGNENLPISMQISGPKDTDAAILDLAEQLETLIGWDNSPNNYLR